MNTLPRPVLIVAGAALVMGLAVIPVGLADQFHEPRGIWAIMGPLIGWSFVGVGQLLASWSQRSRSSATRTGRKSCAPGSSA